MPAHRLGAEGRGAGTVYRDKATGKAVSEEEFAALKAEERKSKKKGQEVGGVGWGRGWGGSPCMLMDVGEGCVCGRGGHTYVW